MPALGDLLVTATHNNIVSVKNYSYRFILRPNISNSFLWIVNLATHKCLIPRSTAIHDANLNLYYLPVYHPVIKLMTAKNCSRAHFRSYPNLMTKSYDFLMSPEAICWLNDGLLTNMALWYWIIGYATTAIILYFIRTRSTETTTHTIHNYHGTHYYQPCPGNI